MGMMYTLKIGYKEKAQNYIDARRRFSGCPESTEKFLFIDNFYGSFNILPILMELKYTRLIYRPFCVFDGKPKMLRG